MALFKFHSWIPSHVRSCRRSVFQSILSTYYPSHLFINWTISDLNCVWPKCRSISIYASTSATWISKYDVTTKYSVQQRKQKQTQLKAKRLRPLACWVKKKERKWSGNRLHKSSAYLFLIFYLKSFKEKQ